MTKLKGHDFFFVIKAFRVKKKSKNNHSRKEKKGGKKGKNHHKYDREIPLWL